MSTDHLSLRLHEAGVRVKVVVVTLVVTSVVGAGIALAANDPYRTQQWNVERVEAPVAWELSRGAGIRIAIVDTGVDIEHPDLVERIARRPDGTVLGRDFVDDDGDPSDENGHGTLVAGIAAATADNGLGVVGIAPQARIMPVRVLDAEGRGDGQDVEDAIRWSVDNGAHVVNLSLESDGPNAPVLLPILAPSSAVRYAWDRGVIVVAASGNDSSRTDDYPADSPVVLVGATTRDDQRASFSDTGRSDALMAPGIDIISTWWCAPDAADCGEEHTYGEADGTSFAAPHVAGAAAILRALGFSHEEAVQRLRDTARDIGAPGPDDETGYGLIDIAAAAGARNPPSSPSPSPQPSPSAQPSPSPDPSPTGAGSPSRPPSPSPSASAPGSDSPSPSPSPDPDPNTGESPSPPPPSASPSEPVSPTASPSPTRSPDPVEAAERDDARAGGGLRVLATVLLAGALGAHAGVRRRR